MESEFNNSSVNTVKSYYNEIANSYDLTRFKNSYGAFLNKQESNILLKEAFVGNVVNFCCGTGRFMEFANCGIDISPNMIEEAKLKHPDKNFFIEDAEHTHLPNDSADTVLCFHAFMHLTPTKTEKIIDEVHRVLNKGGKFIFDFPSKSRRRIFKRRKRGWHGNTEYSIGEISKLTKGNWDFRAYYGVLFFPIHRIPVGMRQYFFYLDSLICKSFIRKYASYLIVILVKK